MFRLMNNLKTTLLLASLMGIFLFVGSFWGRGGIIMALVFGGGMNIVAYFFSDKIVVPEQVVSICKYRW